jgi:hypothetical protein
MADVLLKYTTTSPRDLKLAAYKAEAARRRQAKAAARAHREPDARSPVFLDSPGATAPQPPADIIRTPGPIPEPVPSVAHGEGPAPPPPLLTEAAHDRALLESWEAFRKSFEPLVESNDEYRDYFV